MDISLNANSNTQAQAKEEATTEQTVSKQNTPSPMFSPAAETAGTIASSSGSCSSGGGFSLNA